MTKVTCFNFVLPGRGNAQPARNFRNRYFVKEKMENELVLERQTASKTTTWLGLGISLFSMIVIRQAFRAISPEPGVALTLAREACIFASAATLIWLVRRAEGRPLTSIGLGTSPAWKSIVWGLVTAIACLVPAAALSMMTGYGHGPGSQSFAKLPLWLVTLVVVRAGVVEELFFRGYALERLTELGVGRFAACAIPLAIFAVAHWTGGWSNVLIALVIGGILTAFYLWRRDLVSNMVGHFLVDFVANVLPALFA